MYQHRYRWFDEPANVKSLARHLVKEHNYTAAEILDYFERPWRWDDEWNEMLKIKVPTTRRHEDTETF